VPARINGKTIRTTGNHPYLVRNSLFSQTEKNQVGSNKNQKQSNRGQINISLHNSLSPFVKIINSNQNQTANNSGEKIGIGNIPFNHDLISLANSSEIVKNNPAIANDTPNVNKKSKIPWGRANNGEITPAENQATEIFPKTSEALVNWPMDNFSINNNHNINEDTTPRFAWVSSPPSTKLKSAEAEKSIYLRPKNVPWFSAKEDKNEDVKWTKAYCKKWGQSRA